MRAGAKLNFDNLQSQLEYKPMFQAYGQSKLADSLYALELHRRLTAANSPIVVTSAHPGYAITNLQTSGPGEQKGLAAVGPTLDLYGEASQSCSGKASAL